MCVSTHLNVVPNFAVFSSSVMRYKMYKKLSRENGWGKPVVVVGGRVERWGGGGGGGEGGDSIAFLTVGLLEIR